MLVDNGSSMNMLFGATFDKMILDHELNPMNTPLCEFIGNSITPWGKITLVVEMGEPHQMVLNFIKILGVRQQVGLSWGARETRLKRLGSHHLHPPFVHKVFHRIWDGNGEG